jgi:hypothetical protein
VADARERHALAAAAREVALALGEVGGHLLVADDPHEPALGIRVDGLECRGSDEHALGVQEARGELFEIARCGLHRRDLGAVEVHGDRLLARHAPVTALGDLHDLEASRRFVARSTASRASARSAGVLTFRASAGQGRPAQRFGGDLDDAHLREERHQALASRFEQFARGGQARLHAVERQ